MRNDLTVVLLGSGKDNGLEKGMALSFVSTNKSVLTIGVGL